MITITCEVICDGCRSVIASVGPCADASPYSLMDLAEAKAEDRHASLGVKTYCQDCLKSLKPLMERVK